MDTGLGQVDYWVWTGIIPAFEFSKDSMGRGGWDSMERVIVCEVVVMGYKGGIMARVEYMEHGKCVM